MIKEVIEFTLLSLVEMGLYSVFSMVVGRVLCKHEVNLTLHYPPPPPPFFPWLLRERGIGWGYLPHDYRGRSYHITLNDYHGRCWHWTLVSCGREKSLLLLFDPIHLAMWVWCVCLKVFTTYSLYALEILIWNFE